MKTNHCPLFPTLEQRRPQTNLLGPPRLCNNCVTSYEVMSAAFTLSVKLQIIKKKSYLSDKEITWPFLRYFREWKASIHFKPGCTRWLDCYFESQKWSIKTYESIQTPVSKRRFCFRTRGNVFTQFFLSLSSLPVPWNFYERSQDFFSFLDNSKIIFWKIRQSFIVFFFFEGR